MSSLDDDDDVSDSLQGSNKNRSLVFIPELQNSIKRTQTNDEQVISRSFAKQVVPVLRSLSDQVNPDAYKNMVSSIKSVAQVMDQLAINVDFNGLTAQLSEVAKGFAQQQSRLFDKLQTSLDSFRKVVLPTNLRDIEGSSFGKLTEVVMLEGIPLYGVPRSSLAERLLRANSMSERRTILGSSWKSISSDCRALINGCSTSDMKSFRIVAIAALDALDEGHDASTQALAGSLLDAVTTFYFGDRKSRSRYVPDANGTRTNEAYDEFTIWQYLAFAPIWQAYQKYFTDRGDKIPYTFSRNATAHTVDPRQYNRRNAVQGLMLVCSLIYRIDEEILQSSRQDSPSK